MKTLLLFLFFAIPFAMICGSTMEYLDRDREIHKVEICHDSLTIRQGNQIRLSICRDTLIPRKNP